MFATRLPTSATYRAKVADPGVVPHIADKAIIEQLAAERRERRQQCGLDRVAKDVVLLVSVANILRNEEIQ
jgi:hypothetical protein